LIDLSLLQNFFNAVLHRDAIAWFTTTGVSDVRRKRGLDPQGYPNAALDEFKGKFEKTRGPLKDDKYTISTETVARAGDELWPGWRPKKP
jgi:hypothetical protein